MALLSVPGVAYTPTATKTPTPQNYISNTEYNLLTQYIPELKDEIFNGYGSQMITGFLSQMQREAPIMADLVKWREEGRLTQLGTGVTRSSNVFTLANHTFRVGETIMVRDANGAALRQGQIQSVTTNTFTALNGDSAGWSGTTGLTVYADSNEDVKGGAGLTEGLNSQTEEYTNKPIRVTEYLKESRTNLALRTWVNTGEGYLWYYKNLNDTKLRFDNAIENKMILGKIWEGDLAALSGGTDGTQGLFSALREGNIFGGSISDLDDFDEIIDRLNLQGALTENMMYVTSAQSRLIDRMIKAENVTGVSWGVFQNEAQMVKMGFDGFHYGNYQMKKSSWRFLDNATTEGSATGATKVHGVIIPTGSKNQYDVMKGENASKPILTMNYRVSKEVNKKYEMAIRDWANGTSVNDERTTVFQTERCLTVMGRRNGMIIEG